MPPLYSVVISETPSQCCGLKVSSAREAGNRRFAVTAALTDIADKPKCFLHWDQIFRECQTPGFSCFLVTSQKRVYLTDIEPRRRRKNANIKLNMIEKSKLCIFDFLFNPSFNDEMTDCLCSITFQRSKVTPLTPTRMIKSSYS